MALCSSAVIDTVFDGNSWIRINENYDYWDALVEFGVDISKEWGAEW